MDIRIVGNSTYKVLSVYTNTMTSTGSEYYLNYHAIEHLGKYLAQIANIEDGRASLIAICDTIEEAQSKCIEHAKMVAERIKNTPIDVYKIPFYKNKTFCRIPLYTEDNKETVRLEYIVSSYKTGAKIKLFAFGDFTPIVSIPFKCITDVEALIAINNSREEIYNRMISQLS